MFDTMTLTKAAAGICGALLIYLFGHWAAESIYASAAAGHGDGATQAYSIPVEGGDDQEAEAVEEGPSFEEAFAVADAGAGESLWRNCRSCHANEADKNGTGPSLYGVVGRGVGGMAGFNYSGALQAVFDVWSPENLNAFLINPKVAAPGTAMNYRGLPSVEDRANLIAYLDSLDG